MVQLQHFGRSDFFLLLRWVASAEFLLQWGGPGFTYPLDEKQLEDYIAGANTRDSDTWVFSAIDPSTGRVVGHISIGHIDRKNLSARIGKVLVDPQLRGQGIGQHMMNAVLNFAFNNLRLHRVGLGVFDFNAAAIALYQKVGFRIEGVARDARKFGDAYWNLCEMSILDNEYRADAGAP